MTWVGPLAVPSLQPELPTAVILLLLYPTTTTYSFILCNLFHWRPRDPEGENQTRDLFLFFTRKNVDPLSCWLWDVYSPEYYRARDQQKSETRTQIFTTFVLWNCHFFIFPTVSSLDSHFHTSDASAFPKHQTPWWPLSLVTVLFSRHKMFSTTPESCYLPFKNLPKMSCSYNKFSSSPRQQDPDSLSTVYIIARSIFITVFLENCECERGAWGTPCLFHLPISHVLGIPLINCIRFPGATLPEPESSIRWFCMDASVPSPDPSSSELSLSCAGGSLDLLHSGDNICVITKSITFKKAHLLWAPDKFPYCEHPISSPAVSTV